MILILTIKIICMELKKTQKPLYMINQLHNRNNTTFFFFYHSIYYNDNLDLKSKLRLPLQTVSRQSRKHCSMVFRLFCIFIIVVAVITVLGMFD